MKIIRLLRQCLGIRNARRSKRRSLARSKSVGEVCIASLDLPLETRLLLSATGGSVDDAVAANVEIADLQRQVTSISVSTEATLNGSVDPVTGTLTIEIASNDEAAFSFVPELDIASPLASDSFSLHWQSSNQIVTGLFDFGGRLPNSLSTANGSFIKLPLDVSLRTSDSFSDSIGHDNFNVVFNLVNILPVMPVQQTLSVLSQPRTEVASAHKVDVAIESSVEQDAAPRESSPTLVSVTTHEPSVLFSTDRDKALTAAEVGGGDLFSATAASPHADASPHRRLRNTRLKHIRSRSKAYRESGDALLTLKVTASESSPGSDTSQTGDVTAAKDDAGDLLNAFIQIDTFNVPTDRDDDLSEWLRRQFELDDQQESKQQGDGDEAPEVFVDTSESQNKEQDGQRSQHEFSRIEFLTSDGIVVLALSDSPPEPPEISGIWQRLKFDCNPRGPPLSDSNSAQNFVQQDANADQLTRLRHSITPRGPSVASTF